MNDWIVCTVETGFLPRNPVSKSRLPANGKSRRDEVVDLYQQGRSVGEIAEIFNVKLGTVVNHLWDALRDGTEIAAAPLLSDCDLPQDVQANVLQQFEELGAVRLRPVYDALGESVSYDQLHLLRLYYVISRLA